ncbi:hypothetical protein Zmor_016827 [Zophobas morio]|uniref:Uncharacterized protein n=2 Tax=Zophobas morio TaxID=2755281 RepID=A0AA38I7N3_9CUCU|nr:hypothetical protein Zmor_016827 [Zophobas morio]
MLDRMYLSEERQSMMRLRQEAEEAAQVMELQPPAPPAAAEAPPPGQPEDYDEWACIQRELGCLPQQDEAPPPRQAQAAPPGPPMVANAHAHLQPPKRTASSDSRLETLKRFRVDKHNKRSSEGVHNNSVLNNNSSVQSVSSGINTHHHPNSFEQQGQGDSYENEVENNSIDEQVQSAIDSILNLQQNTALADLDSILS